MTKKSTNLLWLVLIICIAAAGFLLSRQREIVGVDQLGVVISPGGTISVYQAGEQPLVLPIMHRYVTLTAKPIRLAMTEEKSIVITGQDNKEIKVGCQVRYQVEDAAKLVATHGVEAPQVAVDGLIRKLLTEQIGDTLRQENASLDDVQTRVVMVASVHQSLKLALAPSGINVLSFDLIAW